MNKPSFSSINDYFNPKQVYAIEVISDVNEEKSPLKNLK